MAENQDREDDDKRKKKKTVWDRFLEVLQWVAILLGWQKFSMQDIAGARTGTQPGAIQIGDKQMPYWVLKIIARFSKEDEERETVLLHDTNVERDWQEKYFSFRKHLEDEGYDTTEWRLMLIRISRNKDSVSKNILSQIVDADGDISKQMKIAKDNHLLERLGFFVGIGMWFFDHKPIANLLALPIFLLLTLSLASFLYWGLVIVYYFLYGFLLILS
ncbi:MAG: hypothetical protein QG620_940 [Patescibacteria group bacterium]|nr:hypothetical protein [Patescibacteria group bacterium]